ncbi:MAG: hypothetical protein ACI80F_001734 [Natronomonas sp.]|jgi:hypothetical protein
MGCEVRCRAGSRKRVFEDLDSVYDIYQEADRIVKNGHEGNRDSVGATIPLRPVRSPQEKYIRENQAPTDEHWRQQAIVQNIE